MKQKLWITLVTYLAYCIDKELYKAIDYLREQVRVIVEQQEKQNKRILLMNRQRMRVAAKAKKLSRKMLEQCTVLFTPDIVLDWFRNLLCIMNTMLKKNQNWQPNFVKNSLILKTVATRLLT